MHAVPAPGRVGQKVVVVEWELQVGNSALSLSLYSGAQ